MAGRMHFQPELNRPGAFMLVIRSDESETAGRAVGQSGSQTGALATDLSFSRHICGVRPFASPPRPSPLDGGGERG